ncbi:MAG: hypothetical protein AAGA93_02275 [Actinomycetota bacterium]
MSAEVLRPACELAFAVARDGLDAAEPIDPPASMRSFLYVDELPRRAIAAAQQVIEENSDFRHRVASQADERDVGRAGYLWLHRPTGWAVEFEALASADEGDLDPMTDHDPELEAVYKGLTSEPIELITAQPPEPEPDQPLGSSFAEASMAEVTPIGFSAETPSTLDAPSVSSASLGLAPVTDTDHADIHPFDAPEPEIGDDAELASGDGGFEAADALESELDSLRGLVARLATERETVEGSPVPDQDDEDVADEPDEVVAFASPGPSETDNGGLKADLEAAHHELYLTQADLTIARQEREEAQRLQSEALKRQVQLDKELATVREQKADVESQLSVSQAKAISVEERLGRVENQVADADRERDNLRAQLDTMTLERNQIRDERATMRAERDEFRAQLDDITEKTGGVDLVELVQSHKTATAELDSTSRELARIIGQAENYEEQLNALTTETAAVKSERIDLRARLGEAETSLEVTTTQYEALKIDAERTAAELGALRAERDGLQSQLAELQVGLAELLDEQAESRQRNDADRRALNEIRVEYDVVVARLADLDESEQTARGKVEGLIAERDNLLAGRDELLEERGQLRAELATAVGERGAAQEQLGEVQERLRNQDTELQMERRQREELANRLLELDDMAERTAAEQHALLEERDTLLTTAERLEGELTAALIVKQERDELAGQLAEARSSHEAAIEAVRLQLDEAGEEVERVAASRTEVEEQLTAASDQITALQGELTEAEAVRRERDELTAEVAAARASHDEAAKALRAEIDTAARENEQMAAARADVDGQLADTQARLADVERARDLAISERATVDGTVEELQVTIHERDEELHDLRGALAAAKKEVDEATVALQIKESELRTVLGARNADAAEIKGLRGTLDANTQTESQLREAADTLAERERELESLRAELDDLRSQPTPDPEPVDEHASAMPGTEPEVDPEELESTRSELQEATAELEQLRNELAAARVELASTTAELEARDAALPGSDIGAPPVDPLLDSTPVADADRSDELDSMAAEVRSALRGPSMLDSIAGQNDLPGLEADDDQLPVIDQAAPSVEAPSAEAPTPADDDEQVAVEPSEDATAPIDVFDDGPTAPVAEAVPADSIESVQSDNGAVDDDELDAVSELISMKVNSFGPGDLSELGSPSDDELDLAAELARTPTELSAEDIDEALAVGSGPPSILGDASDSFTPAQQPDLAVSRPSGSKRRRIEVPGDIVDDEVAVARYVVGSPDVVLLVDGDSVAQMGWPSLPVAQQRDALVTYLADLSSSSGAAPDVVFDGRLGDDDALPASRAVRIRLSTPPTPPTAALDELVDAYPEQWPIALVTDDVDLAAAAADRGAAVLNNGQLLDLFIAE